VLKKFGGQLYANVRELVRDWLVRDVKSHVLQMINGGHSIVAVTGRTETEKRDAAEKFLRTLKDAWDDHQLCMGMITDVLMYMVSQLAVFTL
jgi:cullin 3